MTASMLDAAALKGLAASGSEARDMLSGEIVVGGVELRDAELAEDLSDGVLLEKLDASSSSVSSSAIVGAASRVAMIGTAVAGWERFGDGRGV
jgi:hypothetical protein